MRLGEVMASQTAQKPSTTALSPRSARETGRTRTDALRHPTADLRPDGDREAVPASVARSRAEPVDTALPVVPSRRRCRPPRPQCRCRTSLNGGSRAGAIDSDSRSLARAAGDWPAPHRRRTLLFQCPVTSWAAIARTTRSAATTTARLKRLVPRPCIIDRLRHLCDRCHHLCPYRIAVAMAPGTYSVPDQIAALNADRALPCSLVSQDGDTTDV